MRTVDAWWKTPLRKAPPPPTNSSTNVPDGTERRRRRECPEWLAFLWEGDVRDDRRFLGLRGRGGRERKTCVSAASTSQLRRRDSLRSESTKRIEAPFADVLCGRHPVDRTTLRGLRTASIRQTEYRAGDFSPKAKTAPLTQPGSAACAWLHYLKPSWSAQCRIARIAAVADAMQLSSGLLPAGPSHREKLAAARLGVPSPGATRRQAAAAPTRPLATLRRAARRARRFQEARSAPADDDVSNHVTRSGGDPDDDRDGRGDISSSPGKLPEVDSAWLLLMRMSRCAPVACVSPRRTHHVASGTCDGPRAQGRR